MYLFIGLKTITLFDQEAQIIDRIRYQQAERILIYIDRLLNRNSTRPNNLKGVIVINNPDSFVGTRISLTSANTLAFILRIPVVSLRFDAPDEKSIVRGLSELSKKKIGQIALPIYSGEPNITIKNSAGDNM